MSETLRNFAAFGRDVRIDERAVIKNPDRVRLGDHVAIDAFVYLSTALDIGSHVHIATMVSVIGGRDAKLVVHDFAGIAAGCRIVCASDDFLFGTGLTNPTIPPQFRGHVQVTAVTLEKHVVLGTNVIVFPGVTIGQGAVVAAGSIVRSDLEPWTVNAGNPAVKVGRRPKDVILKKEAELREWERRNPA